MEESGHHSRCLRRCWSNPSLWACCEPCCWCSWGAYWRWGQISQKNLKCTHKQTNNLYKQSCSRIAFLSDWRFSVFLDFLRYSFSPSLPSGIPCQNRRCWDDRAAWCACSTFGICWANSWDAKGNPRGASENPPRAKGNPRLAGIGGTCKLKQTKSL